MPQRVDEHLADGPPGVPARDLSPTQERLLDGPGITTALQAALTEMRPYVLVTVVDGKEIEILAGGGEEPPDYGQVADLLEYAAECARSMVHGRSGRRKPEQGEPT